MSREELILGCDCMGLHHIARFNYFPHEEDDVIYMSVPAYNYYKALSPFYCWGFQWDDFTRFSFFKRLYFAFSHIFRYEKFMAKWKDGVLDSFGFKTEDEDILYDYLKQLVKEEEYEGLVKDLFTVHEIPLLKSCCFGNFDVCFYVDYPIPGDDSFPLMLQYSVVFHQTKNIWKRLKTGIKYIFGAHSEEISIELNKKDAKLLKAMISYVKEKNNND